MKNEVMVEVAKLLPLFTSGLQQGVDFTKEQLPLLVQEFLFFQLVAHWLFLFTAVLFGFAATWGLKFGYRKSGEHSYDLCVVAGIAIIPCVIGIVYNTYCILYITFAPRMYLLQEFSRLLK